MSKLRLSTWWLFSMSASVCISILPPSPDTPPTTNHISPTTPISTCISVSFEFILQKALNMLHCTRTCVMTAIILIISQTSHIKTTQLQHLHPVHHKGHSALTIDTPKTNETQRKLRDVGYLYRFLRLKSMSMSTYWCCPSRPWDVRSLPHLHALGIVPCIISFSGQLPYFLMGFYIWNSQDSVYNKQSDSIPTNWFLQECASVLVPVFTNIVNFCLTAGQFHSILKESVISPLYKKSTGTLDRNRPIFNLLRLISKK